MFKTWVCLLLLVCLTPLHSTPLVDELKEISMQFQTALTEAEIALNDLVKDLEKSETALRNSKKELKMLRAEAQTLRRTIARLKAASEESEMQKQELEQQLSAVKQRTADLRTSFEDYQKRVAREIRRKKTWRTISILELIIILLGGAAVAIL